MPGYPIPNGAVAVGHDDVSVVDVFHVVLVTSVPVSK